MAYVAGTAVQSKGTRLSDVILSAAYGALKYFERNAAYKRTVAELDRLSDKELNDIGLCRGDISYVAKHGAQAI